MALFGPTMPVPAIDPDTQGFWDACKEHRLVVQQCKQCGSYRFAPAPVCYNCQSFDFDWIQSDGVGEVYTWTVTHRSLHPGTDAAVPYNTVVVELSDCGGAKITSNLLGVEPDAIKPGMKVIVEWDDVTPEISLPRFRPILTRPDEAQWA